MIKEIKGKKLLLIGGLTHTADLIDLAHRNGVKVGVLDYNKGTYVKSLADEVFDENALDVAKVVEVYNENHYDGIISQFNDMLAPYVTKIASRIGKPESTFTLDQHLMSGNKKYFKSKCLEYGIPVPKEFKLSSLDDIRNNKIDYPVIVKPVDSGGSQGVTSCINKEELAVAYEKALKISKSRDVIVEQFLPYDEINVTYIVQDGFVQLAAIHDRYFNEEQQGVIHVPDLYIYPSRYTDMYLEKYNDQVIKMIEGIGVRNGSLFIQACVKGEEVYFYEAGMRLNGCKTYQILEVENDYNTFEHLMILALTGSMGSKTEFSPKFKHWYATINVLGQPGAKICEFRGKKELETYPWLIHIASRFSVGDKIPENAAGTLMQDTTRIHVLADTKEQLIERINIVNELYQLIDENGRNIILQPHNTEEIYKGLNYEL